MAEISSSITAEDVAAARNIVRHVVEEVECLLKDLGDLSTALEGSPGGVHRLYQEIWHKDWGTPDPGEPQEWIRSYPTLEPGDPAGSSPGPRERDHQTA